MGQTTSMEYGRPKCLVPKKGYLRGMIFEKQATSNAEIPSAAQITIHADHYTCRGLKLWTSWDCEAVYVYQYVQRIVKQSGPWSSQDHEVVMAVMYILQRQVYLLWW